MGSARGVEAMLRGTARRDDPRCALAYADVTAWELAEGLGSDAAAEAIGRKDWERTIPGLPARRTFMAIGWVALAAFVIISGLSWFPPSDGIETVDTIIQFSTGGLGVLAAAWSLLSEMRGWEGSDAATWHAKARVKAFEKRIEARRREVRDTLIAIGAERIVIYASTKGTVVRDAFTPDAVDELSLELEARHMVLRLTTCGQTRRFEWLPRDAAVEAAVARFADATSSAASPAIVVSPTV